MGDFFALAEHHLPEPYESVNLLRRGVFEMRTHTHPFWQLILVTEGLLNVTTESGSFALPPGTAHVLPPGRCHALSSSQGYTQIGIDLHPGSETRALIPLLEAHFPQPAQCAGLPAANWAAQLEKHNHAQTPLASAHMVNLLDHILLCCTEAVQFNRPDPFGARLTAFLNERLNCSFQLQEAADFFFVSTPQLERMCRARFHCGVFALFQEQRFRLAQQLLSATELPVSEIGRRVGFSDIAHFSGFFSHRAGVSPRTYRNQIRHYV